MTMQMAMNEAGQNVVYPRFAAFLVPQNQKGRRFYTQKVSTQSNFYTKFTKGSFYTQKL